MKNESFLSSEALASTTRLAAEWPGLESEIGTVEGGKLADLILLEANFRCNDN